MIIVIYTITSVVDAITAYAKIATMAMKFII